MSTDNNKQNLSTRQLRAISLIISGRTISNGVALAGISRATFYKWLQDSSFKKEFERQRKEAIELALHELKMTAGEAIQVLRKLLKAKNDGIRLRSSTAIITYLAKFIEMEEIERRLTSLEEVVNNESLQKKT